MAKARNWGHLTAGEATLAAAGRVKLLVLTHISGRYSDDEILVEATKTFARCWLAADFNRIVV